MVGKRGFTLIELMIVVGIMSILLAAAMSGFLKIESVVSVDGVTTSLIADLKHQQIRAMMGESTTPTTSDWGVYLEANRYTTFLGSSYNPLDPNNFTVNLETNIALQGSLPIQITFTRRSGVIATPISFNIVHTSTNETRTISVNKFGAVTLN